MFEMIKLKYPYDAFEPFIDTETMQVHYEGHYASYTKNFNEKMIDEGLCYGDLSVLEILKETLSSYTYNQGGGYWNHGFYFEALNPSGNEEISIKFNSYLSNFFYNGMEGLRGDLVAKCMNVFGSGYAWLMFDTIDRQIFCMGTKNQDVNHITARYQPLLNIDVWEHAYYLKYKNKKRDAIENHIKVIDWSVVEGRLKNIIAKERG